MINDNSPLGAQSIPLYIEESGDIPAWTQVHTPVMINCFEADEYQNAALMRLPFSHLVY